MASKQVGRIAEEMFKEIRSKQGPNDRQWQDRICGGNYKRKEELSVMDYARMGTFTHPWHC